ASGGFSTAPALKQLGGAVAAGIAALSLALIAVQSPTAAAQGNFLPRTLAGITATEGSVVARSISLSRRPSANVTVALTSDNSDVTFASDSGGNTAITSLSFTTGNWNAAPTFYIVLGDDSDSANDTATVTLTASGGGYAGVTSSFTITVQDIDGGPANFNPMTLADITATEGSVVARSIALSRRPSANVTVALTSDNSDVSFASDSGGSRAITSLSFMRSNWNTAQTFHTVLGDDSDSANDTAEVTLSASGGGYAGVATGYAVTVIDNDEATIVPSISPVVLDEDGSAMTVGVRLSEAPWLKVPATSYRGQSFSVTSSNTSVFTVSPSQLTFDGDDGSGLIWSSSQTLTITPVNDSRFTSTVKDAAINITVRSPRLTSTLSNYNPADFGTRSIPVQVRDDDAPPGLVLSATSLALTEGSTETFTVRLASRPSAVVTVTLAQPSNTDVTVDTDTIAANNQNTLIFTGANWSTAQTVTVSATADADTAYETATVRLTASGGGYGAVTGSVSVNIADSDSGRVAITGSELEAGVARDFTVALTKQPSGNVTVTPIGVRVRLSETVSRWITSHRFSPSNLTFTPSDWQMPQTVSWTANSEDLGQNKNLQGHVSFTADGGGYNLTGMHRILHPVTIINSIPDSITVADSTKTVEEGGDATYSIRLSRAPRSNVTVTASSSNTSAATIDDTDSGTAGDQSTLTFTSTNWSTAQNLTVSALDDANGRDENVTIALSASGGGYSNVTENLTLSITDNDGKLVVTGDLEVGVARDLSVVLTKQPSGNVTVTPSVIGIEIVGMNIQFWSIPTETDFVTVSPSSLTFTPSNWKVAQTVSFTVTSIPQFELETNPEIRTWWSAQGGGYNITALNGIFPTTLINSISGASITAAESSKSVEEGGDATYSIRLSHKPRSDVTVTAASSNTSAASIDDTDSATAGDQSTLTFTADNWSTAQNLTVSTSEDDDNRNDSVAISLTANGGGYFDVAASLSLSVTDRDVLMLSAETLTVDEDDSETFTVRLGALPTANVTVTLMQPSNTDVTLDTDTGTASNQNTLTFTAANWETPQPVKVSAADDDDAVNDTAMISLTASGGGYAGATGSVSVSVTEDDSAGLDISESSLAINEDGSDSFTVALTSEPSDEVTVKLLQSDTSSPDVTFDTDSDTNGDQVMLTFTAANWDTAQSVTVSAAADDDLADDAATINLTAAGGDYAGKTGSVTVSVTDEDEGELTLSATTLPVTEGSSGSFTVALTNRPSANVTVTLTQSGTTNDDVTLDETSLTFTTGNWKTAQTVTVSAAHDGDAADETATISLSAAGGGYSATGSVTVNVTDDDNDDNNRLDLSATSLTLVEGRSGSFTVALTSEPSANVTVTLARTGASSADVTFTPNTPLTFTAGNYNVGQTVTVRVADDDDAVVDMATISLSAAGGGYAGVTGSVSVRVTETDTAGFELSESDGELDVNEEGTATFTVRLTSEPSAQVTVSLSQPRAGDNDDVTITPSQLTFTTGNWDGPQTVTVSAAADDDLADDTATVNLSAAGGDYAGKTASVSVSIEDNDEGALTLSSARLAVGEGGSESFTVALAAVPSGAVSVTLRTSDTDVRLSTSVLSFNVSDWQTPQAIEVSAAADVDSEGETATITLTASGAGYAGVTGSVAVAVTDTTPQLILDPTERRLEISEGRSGVFTARLSIRPQSDTAIALASDNNDVTLIPASLTFTAGNWDTAQSVTVQTLRDPDPIDDTATVRLTGDGIADGSVTVTVTDDGNIGLDLSATELTLGEGAEASISVRLHAAPSADLSVALASDNADVTLSAASLTFTSANWSTAQSVTLSAGQDDDSVDAPAVVSLSGSGITDASVTVTVTDDDTGVTAEA
ncbi:MAG: hypothetical protein ISN29_02780, partial [Gammaproteobacteria bacterium AqS3]|nr:hypothetical protein [Gammaproteobacteria bacterium AqS3]